MGKKGEALRALKAERTVYTFTRRQLEDHDKAVVAAKTEEIKRKVREEWQKRSEEFGAQNPNSLPAVMGYVSSIVMRILIEKWHWKPIRAGATEKQTEQYMVYKLAVYLQDEISAICNDETKDIREEAQKILDQYGVGFILMEDEDDKTDNADTALT